MNAKTQAFLRSLESLCREYDAVITGCGCCGSPSVAVSDEDIDNVEVLAGEVQVTEGDEYKQVQLDKPTIVIDDHLIDLPAGSVVKVDDVRKTLDAALRKPDSMSDCHPWHSREDCRAHNEGLSCCLDPGHKDYDSLLDYLAERIARGLS